MTAPVVTPDGPEVEADPRSSYFGKIQVGPSTVDLWGGSQQIARYAAQWITGERKTREGVVVSDAMQKTRVVKVDRVYRHPRYERVVRVSKRLKAHDETNESRVGDRVLIEETRPLSKEKRWRIRSILTRAS